MSKSTRAALAVILFCAAGCGHKSSSHSGAATAAAATSGGAAATSSGGAAGVTTNVRPASSGLSGPGLAMRPGIVATAPAPAVTAPAAPTTTAPSAPTTTALPAPTTTAPSAPTTTAPTATAPATPPRSTPPQSTTPPATPPRSTPPASVPAPKPAPRPLDISAPVVTITSPRRGHSTTASAVTVRGQVRDSGSGVDTLLVDGDLVTPGSSGAFQKTVSLAQGLNTIEVLATDKAGNAIRHRISVVQGRFLQASRPVEDAIKVRLNRGVFAKMEQEANAALTKLDLDKTLKARNPLENKTLDPKPQLKPQLKSLKFEVNSAFAGKTTARIAPLSGKLGLRADMVRYPGAKQALEIVGTATGHVVTRVFRKNVNVPFRLKVTVQAESATLTAEPTFQVTAASGNLSTDWSSLQVDLQRYTLKLHVMPIPKLPRFAIPIPLSTLTRLVAPRLNARIEQAVEDYLAKPLKTEVEKNINLSLQGVGRGIRRTVLGQQVTIDVIPASLRFDRLGAEIVTLGNVAVASNGRRRPSSGYFLGSLVTPSSAPYQSRARDIHLSLNDDLLNRVGYSAWKAGLLDLELDSTTAKKLGLPASLQQLDAGFLKVFLPNLPFRSSDPIKVELSPATPPVFKPVASPDVLQVGLGDLALTISVAPPGKPKVVLLRVGLQVTTSWNVGVQAGTLLRVTPGKAPPVIRTDIKSSLIPLSLIAVENLIDQIAPPALGLLTRVWSGVAIPLPALPKVRLSKVDLRRDVLRKDFLTLSGDLEGVSRPRPPRSFPGATPR